MSPPQTPEEWLELPELQMPEDVVEHRFLKLGMLPAARRAALAAGVEEPWSPPEGGPTGSIVILGTATIDTAEGPRFFRLPSVLAEWAFEMVALAHDGVRVFPRRVRLRAVQGGIEVAPVLDVSRSPNDTKSLAAPTQQDPQRVTITGTSVDATRPERDETLALQDDGPNVLTVYVDESGNTGDAAAGSTSGFGGQRVFTLVGVGDDAGPGSIEKALEHLRSKHGVKATEIKKRTMARYPEFVSDIVRHISASNSIFVEIMDKKFYLAINLVTFALLGPRFDPFRQIKLANEFADIVTDIVDDAALIAYGEFGRAADRYSFESFEATFRSAILRAKLTMGLHQEREFQLIKLIETAFGAALHERGTSDYLSFIPPSDVRSTGQRIAMLPHVQAFSHLLARINRQADRWPSVRVVHDRQAQFDVVLRNSASFLESNERQMAEAVRGTCAESHADWCIPPGRCQLTFADSRVEPGIQVADVLARLCTQRMNALLAGASPETYFENVFRMLHDLGNPGSGVGVNIVATTKTAERFWKG